ncbi:uncharacterized protein LOC130405723 [Gadus chalcogrammus]|uniref:uncharacterized protein LOC130405723 n=1 Tax=Gadus chalcogrammus TaxID=1042646 RepID=UPI0024C4D0A2|nr:uncharacterized protein LOC130405723 [Gadus chalcogrammus]
MTTLRPSMEDRGKMLTSVVEEIRRAVTRNISGAQLLHTLLRAPWLYGLLKVYDCLLDFKIMDHRPTFPDASGLAYQIMDDLKTVQCSDEGRELYKILQSPHIQALLSSHDSIARLDYEPVLPPLPEELPGDQDAMRIVCLVKNNQPLGATIKRDEETGEIYIARVIHGGLADRSDGAPAMVGRKAGAVSLLSEKVANSRDHNQSLIKKLREEFEHRFSDFRNHEKSINLFQNPFSCVPAEKPAQMQFELINLQESSEARAAYRDRNLIEFYKGLSPATLPALRQHANRMVSVFGSTYICEKTFSTMAINKSKLRSRLTDGHLHDVLRIATTEMEQDIRGIVVN